MQDRHRPFALYTAVLASATLLLGGCTVYMAPSHHSGPVAYRAAPLPAYPAVEYGVVQRIEVSDVRAQTTGAGTLAGGLIGGAVGSQFGGGSGRALATVLGAFSGAVIGTQAEQQQAAAASYRVYQVVVQFDNGSKRVFDYRAVGNLKSGDRVRMENGALGPA